MITTQGNLSDWSQKYRPNSLEEMILPTSIKRPLITIRERKVGPHLLFHGKHGTGKTTASTLLFAPDRTKFSDVRGAINHHVVTSAIYHSHEFYRTRIRGVVVLDSVDQLARKFFIELEQLAARHDLLGMLILTAALPKKIPPAIHSCVVSVNFDQMIGDADLRQQMYVRMMEILENETLPRKDEVVRSIVLRWFPDMRQIVNRIQFEIGNHV